MPTRFAGTAPIGLGARQRTNGVRGQGRCGRCGTDLGKLEGVPHQAICPKRPRHGPTGARRFHLRFECDDPAYWLDLEVDVGATLLDLDRWLRRLWLDCPQQVATRDGGARESGCRGHHSVWEIWGVGYPIDPPPRETSKQSTPTVPSPHGSLPRDAQVLEPKALESQTLEASRIRGRRLDLEVELAEPLRPGVRLQVLYDLHAPTLIRGQVLDERRVYDSGRCEVLARNRTLRWRCSVCSALATLVCVRCRGHRPCLVCADHWQAHAAASKCGGRWLWPIANSPRMGCCSDAERR